MLSRTLKLLVLPCLALSIAGCGSFKFSGEADEFVPVSVNSQAINLPSVLDSTYIQLNGVSIDSALQSIDFAKNYRHYCPGRVIEHSGFLKRGCKDLHGKKIAFFWTSDERLVIGFDHLEPGSGTWVLSDSVIIDPQSGQYRRAVDTVEKDRLNAQYQNFRVSWIDISERDLNVLGQFWKSIVSFSDDETDYTYQATVARPDGKEIARLAQHRVYAGSDGSQYLLKSLVCGLRDDRKRGSTYVMLENNCPTNTLTPTPDESKVVVDLGEGRIGVMDIVDKSVSGPIISQKASLPPMLFRFAINHSFQKIALWFETDTGGIILTADIDYSAL